VIERFTRVRGPWPRLSQIEPEHLTRRRRRAMQRLAWAHRQFELAEARIRELDAELAALETNGDVRGLEP
jgi:hypothetical protein